MCQAIEPVQILIQEHKQKANACTFCRTAQRQRNAKHILIKGLQIFSRWTKDRFILTYSYIDKAKFGT